MNKAHDAWAIAVLESVPTLNAKVRLAGLSIVKGAACRLESAGDEHVAVRNVNDSHPMATTRIPQRLRPLYAPRVHDLLRDPRHPRLGRAEPSGASIGVQVIRWVRPTAPMSKRGPTATHPRSA